MLQTKQHLVEYCRAYVRMRMDTAQKAMEAAQVSAREETKSSVGDKYETGRAMMQLEVEKNAVQLAEAVKLNHALDQLEPIQSHAISKTGSLVITNQGNFFIAISAGRCSIHDTVYMLISPVSPIGSKLMGLKAGDSFAFHQRQYVVQHVW